MFLRLNTLILSLVMWLIPLNTKKIIIPKLNMEVNYKVKDNYIYLSNIESLEYNDTFLIKDGNTSFYYRILEKYSNCDNLVLKENEILLIDNSSCFKGVLTGELIKDNS